MLGIIIGALVLVGIIIAVVCSVVRTPKSLRGYYGAMFGIIATIGVVGVVVLSVLGLL